MSRSLLRGSPLVSLFAVGFVLIVGCGGKLQAGTVGTIADDAAAAGAGDAAASTVPVASSNSDDAAASPGAVFDDASIVLLPAEDASGVGASLDGGIDPNGPCPNAPGHWACPVEGARLCGLACSLQCSCTDGFWLCRLPPC